MIPFLNLSIIIMVSLTLLKDWKRRKRLVELCQHLGSSLINKYLACCNSTKNKVQKQQLHILWRFTLNILA